MKTLASVLLVCGVAAVPASAQSLPTDSTVPVSSAAALAAIAPTEDGYRSCADDMANALAELRKQNVEGVILDLRNNGGGPLIEAIRVTGLFIRSGPVVQAKEGLRVRILPDIDPVVAYDGPLVVLVNRATAGAAEALAAILQGDPITVADAIIGGNGGKPPIRPPGGRAETLTRPAGFEPAASRSGEVQKRPKRKR